MDLEKIKKLNIPHSPGCYQFINEKGEIIYVGKAADLCSRVLSYWQKSANHSPVKFSMMKQIREVRWLEVDSEIEALLLEANLIKRFQPHYNVMLKDDKRHAYLKVTTEDEVPGVFITRKITKSGKFYGPFVSIEPLKQVLKTIRKIWPYCTMRSIQKKPCFYYQIGRCTGVCGGVIDAGEYRDKIIKPIILFFEGKKGSIVRELKNEAKLKESNGDFEGARKALFQIKNIETVLKNSNVLSVSEKYAADVVELSKLLELPKIPARIEGYDISNIFGKEATGSMVVFVEGEPDKNEYRKFKIKDVGMGGGDTGMLKEVLERRFSHTDNSPASRSGYAGSRMLRNNKLREKQITENEKKIVDPNYWAMPDLIIIDGGKGQLNAASRVLKKYKLDIAVIAISKGAGLRSAIARDKLFFPGEKEALELPLASPALHLVKRVRDEAHRFAIGYHRKLRKKSFIPPRRSV